MLAMELIPAIRARLDELDRLGLLSNERAEVDNPAVDVLAALLPRTVRSLRGTGTPRSR
jgi:hypothetical protein